MSRLKGLCIVTVVKLDEFCDTVNSMCSLIRSTFGRLATALSMMQTDMLSKISPAFVGTVAISESMRDFGTLLYYHGINDIGIRTGHA